MILLFIYVQYYYIVYFHVYSCLYFILFRWRINSKHTRWRENASVNFKELFSALFRTLLKQKLTLKYRTENACLATVANWSRLSCVPTNAQSTMRENCLFKLGARVLAWIMTSAYGKYSLFTAATDKNKTNRIQKSRIMRRKLARSPNVCIILTTMAMVWTIMVLWSPVYTKSSRSQLIPSQSDSELMSTQLETTVRLCP